MNEILKVLKEFDDYKIKYVHFKSNTNLDESFAGIGDFDILVDKLFINKVEEILSSNGARRHNPVNYGIYPGVDNWILFDEESGLLYHLHLHYQLATGKALLKDYILPWSELILETRVRDEKWNIYKTDPNLEIILLHIRIILKSHTRDNIKASLGIYKLHPALLRERIALQSLVNWEKVESFCNSIFSVNELQTVLKIIKSKEFTSSNYSKLCRIVRGTMVYYRRTTELSACVYAKVYRIGDIYHKILSRKFGGCQIVKKTSLSGGLIVAFVGVDGAGKSTVTQLMNTWIGKKIECKRFYMGVGDGKVTVFASILKCINNFIIKHSRNKIIVNKIERVYFSKKPFIYCKKFMKMLLIYDAEKNNYEKILKMQKYRMNGGICLLDRYPQLEQYGQNDGPKMQLYREMLGYNIITDYLVRKEQELLSIVKIVKPDIVFRLNISATTSMDRKPEQLDIKIYEQKIIDLNKITFQNASIIDIDAEKDFDNEIKDIKKILWRYI